MNAFPTIMRQVFRQAEFKTPFLDQYVDEREKVFNDVCTGLLDRVFVKKLFLISLHGGDYFQEAKVVLPFLPEFQRELFSSITQLLNLPRYAKFKALAQKNEWNPNGRAIARRPR